MQLANSIFFVLVIVSGLSTLGVLFAGLISMSRGPTESVERARGSNKLMWWRVRLQLLTLVFILLIAGPKLLRGMPRTYFLSAWAFLAATVASVVLFLVTYFSLTAFEIIVFALIFGWIAVFIRFLGVSGQRE